MPKKQFFRPKTCRFCEDKNLTINYKEVGVLKHFVMEGGKIVPSRINGNCAFHQRELATAIKQARVMALMSFTSGDVAY
jgi:small subunit ribosomal protein S18